MWITILNMMVRNDFTSYGIFRKSSEEGKEITTYIPVGSFLSRGIRKYKGPELITYRLCSRNNKGASVFGAG